MQTLTLGFSPCPNDTFIFHALVHGIVQAGDLSFRPRLADVETLNRLALANELDVAKVSYGALPYLLDDYVLLRSGGALGRGCGPLIVAKADVPAQRLGDRSIAVPGRFTTANLLLRLFLGGAGHPIEMEYDRIMPAVAAGEVDAGLIIHESRFTYREHNLRRVVDLGEWWEATTGSPIPLGAIVARRALGGTTAAVEHLIRESVRHARQNPRDSADYVRENAREMSDSVTEQHIALYVNDFSIDIGTDGERAIAELMRRGEEAGLFRGARNPCSPPVGVYLSERG